MRFLPCFLLSTMIAASAFQTTNARQPSTLGACMESDNKISLYKDIHDDTYKLVFENLNELAKPDWVDIHIHSPSTGEANVRILSNGKLNSESKVEQPGLVVRNGETLTHFVTYGLHDGTACNTQTMQFTRNDANINNTNNNNNNNINNNLAMINNVLASSTSDSSIENDSNMNEVNRVNEMNDSITDFNILSAERSLSSSLSTNSMDEINDASDACPLIKLQRRLVVSPSHEDTYKLIFDIPTNSTNTVDYLELHYKVNNKPLTNLRLGNTLVGGSSVNQDGIVLRPNDNLTYFVTYSVGGRQCDTDTYVDTLEE